MFEQTNRKIDDGTHIKLIPLNLIYSILMYKKKRIDVNISLHLTNRMNNRRNNTLSYNVLFVMFG